MYLHNNKTVPRTVPRHKTKTISAIPPVLVPRNTRLVRVMHNLCISNAKVFPFISQHSVSVLHIGCSATVPHTADHVHNAACCKKVEVSRWTEE